MGRRDFGQILKLKGKWAVRWRENGRVRQKAIGGSKALAQRFLAKRQSELEEQRALGHIPIEPIRFETLLDQYETLFAGEKQPATVIREATYMRGKMAPFFKGMEVGKITRADVERFLMLRVAKDGISGSTRNKLINMLSTFFQKATALNHARENPCRGIKRQQEPLKPVPFVALDAQERLIAEMPDSLRSLVALLLDTGLRLGEALRLTWEDVDFRRQIVTVRISKNMTGREVPFTSRGRQALQEASEASSNDLPRVPDLVFPQHVDHSLTGEVRLKTYRRLQWAKGKKAAGLPTLRIHDLRHTWAVTCARAGVTLGELRELGGWKSLEMVLRYSRHAPDNAADLARSRLEGFLQSGERGHVKGHGSGA